MANKESKEIITEEEVEALKIKLTNAENCLKEKDDIIQQLEREINSRNKQFDNLASVYNLLLDKIIKTGIE